MDDTYAPRSPDLSGFLSSTPTKPAYATRSTASTYAPRSPVIPTSFGTGTSNMHHAQAAFAYNQAVPGGRPDLAEISYIPSIPPLPTAHTFATAPVLNMRAADGMMYSRPGDPAALAGAPSYQMHHTRETPLGIQHQRKGFGGSEAQQPMQDDLAMPAVLKNPNPNNVTIKTKFPVARIKRIMQADEEVGKVAQATPVAVTRALELFMISLVTAAATKAREKGTKRINAMHLKSVVEGDKQWDFLEDIVSKVREADENEAPNKKTPKEKRAKSESLTEDEDDAPPRKREPRSKKKRVDD